MSSASIGFKELVWCLLGQRGGRWFGGVGYRRNYWSTASKMTQFDPRHSLRFSYPWAGQAEESLNSEVPESVIQAPPCRSVKFEEVQELFFAK